jgi:glycosyltransferase involved in cell wall biosynthesis
MKVALCKTSFAGPISGADETLLAYALELRRAGHEAEVIVLFPFNPKDHHYRQLRAAGVPVHCVVERAPLFTALRFGRQLFTNFVFVFLLVSDLPHHARRVWQAVLSRLATFYYGRCEAFLQRHGADLLHVFTPDTGTTVFIRAGRSAGVPVLYHELGTPFHVPGLEGYYEKLAEVSHLCTEVAALSPTLAGQWRGRLPHEREVSVLPLIINNPHVGPIPRRDLPVDTIFGFAARMEKGKGPQVLIDSFAELRRTRPGAYLRLAGSGPQVYEVKSRARQLGVSASCDFVGYYQSAEGRIAFMRTLDAFVLPSFAEGTPNSIIEAMACGLPMIASAVGGIPDLVTPEVGILTPPGDDTLVGGRQDWKNRAGRE